MYHCTDCDAVNNWCRKAAYRVFSRSRSRPVTVLLLPSTAHPLFHKTHHLSSISETKAFIVFRKKGTPNHLTITPTRILLFLSVIHLQSSRRSIDGSIFGDDGRERMNRSVKAGRPMFVLLVRLSFLKTLSWHPYPSQGARLFNLLLTNRGPICC